MPTNREIRISVIIPVFNGEQYLEKCIESVLGKRSKCIELVIVNDGSTDKTEEICLRYQQLYSASVKYYRQKNFGVVAARKIGVTLASGDWILFLDADDWIDPNPQIFTYLLSFEAPEIDIIAYKLIKEYDKEYQSETKHIMPEIPYGVYEGKYLASSVIYKDFFKFKIVNSMYAGLIRKSLIAPILAREPKDIVWSEDGACMLLAYWDSRCVIMVDDIVYHYRINKMSFTRVHNKELYKSQLAFYEFLRDEFIQRNAWEIMKPKIEWMMIRDFMIGDYKLLFHACKEYLYPFSDVKPGMRIALYGMGDMGQEYLRALRMNKIYPLIFTCDKNKEKAKEGLSLEQLYEQQDQVDKIVITVTNINLSISIRENLLDLGIQENKISLMNPNVLNGEIIDRIYGFLDRTLEKKHENHRNVFTSIS